MSKFNKIATQLKKVIKLLLNILAFNSYMYENPFKTYLAINWNRKRKVVNATTSVS